MSVEVIVLLGLLAVQTWLMPKLNNKHLLFLIPGIFVALSLYVFSYGVDVRILYLLYGRIKSVGQNKEREAKEAFKREIFQ